MYTKDIYVSRIKFMALSQIRQIQDSIAEAPLAYRRNADDYLDNMHYIISHMKEEKLAEFVEQLHQNYIDMGMDDERYVADSLLMVILALYQNEIGENNVYDEGWDGWVEDYFRTQIA